MPTVMTRGSRGLTLLTLLFGAWILLWQTQMITPTERATAIVEARPIAPLVGAAVSASRRQAAAQAPASRATYWIPDASVSASPAVISQCGPAPGPSSGQEPLSPVEKPGSCPDSLLEVAMSACRIATSRLGAEGELLLIGGSDEAASREGGTDESAGRLVDLGTRLLVAQRAVGSRLLLVACSRAQAELAQALGVAWWRLPPAPSARGASSALWRAAAALLSSGLAVLVSSSGTRGMGEDAGAGTGAGGGGGWAASAGRGGGAGWAGADWASGGGALWLADPWAHLSRDVDVEVSQLLDPLARADKGSVVGTSDPPMGWSAYAQSMATPLLDPCVVALQPTSAAAELASAYARALAAGPPEKAPAESRTRSTWGLGAGDAAEGSVAAGKPGAPGAALWSAWQLTRLALQPAHDGEVRPGVSLRILRRACFAATPPAATGVPAAVMARARDAMGVGEALLGPTAVEAVRRTVREVVAGRLDSPMTAAEELEAPPVAAGAAGPVMRLRQGEPNEILSSLDWGESEARMRSGQGCRVPAASAGFPRPARWVVPPGGDWPSPAACAVDDDARALCDVVREVAVDREVLVAVRIRPPAAIPPHPHQWQCVSPFHRRLVRKALGVPMGADAHARRRVCIPAERGGSRKVHGRVPSGRNRVYSVHRPGARAAWPIPRFPCNAHRTSVCSPRRAQLCRTPSGIALSPPSDTPLRTSPTAELPPAQSSPPQVSNQNILQMLGLFLDGLRAAGIRNGLVAALDAPTADFVRRQGGHAYVRRLRSHTGSTDNHATSGLKFAVLLELVSVGASVLLSDVDVLWLQNP